MVFEGTLPDTGSPVIVAMKALAKPEQSPADWEQDISSLLEEPILTMYSHEGGQFDIVRQLTAVVCMTRLVFLASSCPGVEQCSD